MCPNIDGKKIANNFTSDSKIAFLAISANPYTQIVSNCIKSKNLSEVFLFVRFCFLLFFCLSSLIK
jgi:hypothetical protein